MNRLIILLIAFFFITNCSLNENSKIWKDKDKGLLTKSNIKKVFEEKKTVVEEFNQGLNIDLSDITTNNIFISNQNDFGSQSYEGELNKIGSYKFSKLDKLNQINYKPLFIENDNCCKE